MSQSNKKKAQAGKSQAEFSVDISGEKTHVEITLALSASQTDLTSVGTTAQSLSRRWTGNYRHESSPTGVT
jgi:hypothetical protein